MSPCINAVRPDGNIRVRCEKSDQQRIEVRIADDGCGIDSEVLPRVFELFFTTKPSGTGTGLAGANSRPAVFTRGAKNLVFSAPYNVCCFHVTRKSASSGMHGTKRLHGHEIWLELGVAVLFRPYRERHGGEFIHDGNGEAVPGQVHGFDVGFAGVAGLDADVAEIFRREHR